MDDLNLYFMKGACAHFVVRRTLSLFQWMKAVVVYFDMTCLYSMCKRSNPVDVAPCPISYTCSPNKFVVNSVFMNVDVLYVSRMSLERN